VIEIRNYVGGSGSKPANLRFVRDASFFFLFSQIIRI